MSRYTAVTTEDLRAMLDAIGVASVDELFERQIPAPVRLGRALDLPAGMAEQEVYEHLRDLAARNVSTEDEVRFLGAGMYDHYVPAVIDMLMGRSEFLTPYTPYQPEVSQGNLQVMFEYQTAISELTALPVSNAVGLRGPERGGQRGLPGSPGQRPAAVRGQRRAAPARAARPCAPTPRASEPRSSRCALRDGVTDPDAWARGDGRGRRRGVRRSSPTCSAPSRTSPR